MSALDLLATTPAPTEQDIRRWLKGNYCRCTGPPDGLINDDHGSAAYRAHLISVLAARAVAAAICV
jgi:xanthine dehydrogenase iron-sulfur cluster and FAD-binding subunit A